MLSTTVNYPHDPCRHHLRCLLCRGLVVLTAVLLFQPVADLLSQGHTQAGSNRQLITTEYQLKAVYLYNFLHFVNWPKKTGVSDSTKPFIIGVVGESPFGDALAEIKANLPVAKQKEISIISFGPYRQGMDLSQCHLLFVSSSEQKKFSSIVNALKGKPVLTVGDHDSFLEAGGMINLITYHGKVRWEINRAPVQQSDLRLSAQLLAIAVNVLDQRDTHNVSGEKNQ